MVLLCIDLRDTGLEAWVPFLTGSLVLGPCVTAHQDQGGWPGREQT
jgi:hypothetical protein